MQNRTDETIITTTEVCRYYRRGSTEVRAVDGVSISVRRGELLSIAGSSGSGKSTLLNLLAGLDMPTSGHIEVDGMRLDQLNRRDLARYRAQRIGMVFQSFNLIGHYSAQKNVEAALYFTGAGRRERVVRAEAMLERLGLSDRMVHRPADLSGGEQQRVALARALVKKPEILFADEPTGNLDYENSDLIAKLLKELHIDGLTVILVTHDLALAREISERQLQMNYGQLVTGDGSNEARS